MNTSMFQGAFYHLLSRRAMLAEELARKFEEIRVQEEALKAELMQTAPKDVEYYIKNVVDLDSLFRYGKFSGKIHFEDKDSGFRNMADTKKKIEGLKKAWKGVIKIDVSFVDHGDGRANINFSAVL